MNLIEATSRPITPEEYFALPDSIAYELVGCQLEERHVSRESSRVAAGVVTLLSNADRKAGEQVEVYGADLSYQCFAGDPKMVRRADASVIRRSRLAGVAADAGTTPIPADLAVEVLSPHDLASRVSRKVKLYLDNGFRVVWVVDPEVRTVAVYTADAPGRVLREGDEIDAGDLLPGFRLRVGDFFAPPASPTAPA